jgi:hypothetical protein
VEWGCGHGEAKHAKLRQVIEMIEEVGVLEGSILIRLIQEGSVSQWYGGGAIGQLRGGEWESFLAHASLIGCEIPGEGEGWIVCSEVSGGREMEGLLVVGVTGHIGINRVVVTIALGKIRIEVRAGGALGSLSKSHAEAWWLGGLVLVNAFSWHGGS